MKNIRQQADITFNCEPLTKEQIDMLTDAEFEHTDEVAFVTPKGKTVRFAKQTESEWVKEQEGTYGNRKATAWCRHCNHYIDWYIEELGQITIRHWPRYCSYCGAKMQDL